jgi:hypothetical protein
MDSTLNKTPNQCDELLLSAYLDGEVTAEERAAVESHLASCAACTKAIFGMRGIDATLRETVAPSALHHNVSARIARASARDKIRLRMRRIAIPAAAVILAFAGGVWLGVRVVSDKEMRLASNGSGIAPVPPVAHKGAVAPDTPIPTRHERSADTPDTIGETNDAMVETDSSIQAPAPMARITMPRAELSVPASGNLRPLDITLPPPYFGGTPLSYASDHLEERSFRPREPFLAPIGTRMVSLGKTVSSSDPDPTFGRLSMLTDSRKGYQTEFLVELAAGTQWVQIDLGGPCEIYAIVIWHFHAADRVYFDVVARSANDADFTKNVETIYNNDYDNSSGLGIGRDREYIDSNEGRLVDCGGIVGQYVRCYSNGNTTDDTNHYVEVEVWGIPIDSSTDDKAARTEPRPTQ